MIVTDHAVLRYMERAMGLDISAIKAEIVSMVNAGLIGSELIVVEDGRIVTVLGEGMRVNKAETMKRRRVLKQS